MEFEYLREAMRNLDSAIELTNRGLHGIADDWDSAKLAAASEILEQAIAEMQAAVQEIESIRPGAAWGVGDAHLPPAGSVYLLLARRRLEDARKALDAAAKGQGSPLAREFLARSQGHVGRALEGVAAVAGDAFYER